MKNDEKKTTAAAEREEAMSRKFAKIAIGIVIAVGLIVALYFAIKTTTAAMTVSEDIPAAKFVDSPDVARYDLPIKFLQDSSVLYLSGTEFVRRNKYGGVHLGSGTFDPATGETFLHIGPAMTLEGVKDSLLKRQQNAIESSTGKIETVLDQFVK